MLGFKKAISSSSSTKIILDTLTFTTLTIIYTDFSFKKSKWTPQELSISSALRQPTPWAKMNSIYVLDKS